MRLTFIDNFDSFTYNLVHLIGALGADITVYRNNAKTTQQIMAEKPDAIVLSPGPCTPNEAGICLDLIKAASNTIPMLGVCLGHQAMGQVFGGEVIRAPIAVHGKVASIRHANRSLFKGINGNFAATRYHSLIVKRETLPSCFEITAETQDGLIMGLAHHTRPIAGVQFHPESIASEHGSLMMKNFIDMAQDWNKKSGRVS
jgi:anthranilate synthase component II